MIIKLIGATLVCSSCALLGLYLAKLGNLRTSELSELKRALYILKAEIEFARNPLPAALSNIAARVEYPVAELFSVAADRASRKDGADFKHIWQDCIKDYASTSRVADEDLRELAALGAALGYLDKALQRATLDQCILYIDDKLTGLSAANAKNAKMLRGLGVVCGVLITVVLL